MPISSSAAAFDKKRVLKVKNKSLTPDSKHPTKSKDLLNVGSVFPKAPNKVIKRSHSTLSVTESKQENAQTSELLNLQLLSDGTVHITRTSKEKEKNVDRLCLDRRGLTVFPVINGETKLRLLSLQHNLINNLNSLSSQSFPFLVFLDIYDNQIDRIYNLDYLENLRVLLMGKNRIKRIEGLDNLKKLEVLDLHGNQIGQIFGLTELSELKVLNLAGNQIRHIGFSDFEGLSSLQELNLRRNRLKKLMGFGYTTSLQKLFISNNEIQNVEDMKSIAKASNIRELSIDNNPVTLGSDCISFLVSYLPKLINLNNMQVTEQVRKAAMAWRRNKECTNSTYMDLTSDVGITIRREEVISNARTNWELLRTQTRGVASSSTNVEKITHLKPDTDIIFTSLSKNENQPKSRSKLTLLPDKSIVTRTNSQDTDNSHTSSSNPSGDLFRLPPILVPIINKLEKKKESVKDSGSSTGPNLDSASSVLSSHTSEGSSSSCESSDSEDMVRQLIDGCTKKMALIKQRKVAENVKASNVPTPEAATSSDTTTETSSNLSTNTAATVSSNISEKSSSRMSIKSRRSVKSAGNSRVVNSRTICRAATAKVKSSASPTNSIACNVLAIPREREQGGDYLIEICGRHLNVYGQGALRFVDKSWCPAKANDVNTVNFNYANFNHISPALNKMKTRFPNAENFVFKETNMYCLGQLNALAEIQGIISLTIGKEGNPIYEKNWESYAIYRLSHWGLKIINGREITEKDVQAANLEYESLSDLVLISLPDVLLQPLLVRLQIDVNATFDSSAKKWLMSADPALKSVVSKEALQWKKIGSVQEDLLMRQKARSYMIKLMEEMCNTIKKLKLLDERWSTILKDIIKNTLLDYSQLDLYMKRKLNEIK